MLDLENEAFPRLIQMLISVNFTNS